MIQQTLSIRRHDRKAQDEPRGRPWSFPKPSQQSHIELSWKNRQHGEKEHIDVRPASALWEEDKSEKNCCAAAPNLVEDDGFVSHSLLPSLISVNIKSCAVDEVPEQSVILLPENKQPY